MPSLLRAYLLMGGWVSDHAVIDKKLNTLHVFTGLEVSKIPNAKKRFLLKKPWPVYFSELAQIFMSVPLIQLHQVCLGFGGSDVFKNVDLVFNVGARCCLVGRNGSG